MSCTRGGAIGGWGGQPALSFWVIITLIMTNINTSFIKYFKNDKSNFFKPIVETFKRLEICFLVFSM